MKPKRIILIRHGESEGNCDRNVYSQKPDYALLLTEKGRQQADHVGQQLLELIGNETMQFMYLLYFVRGKHFSRSYNIFPSRNMPGEKSRVCGNGGICVPWSNALP